MKIFWWTVVFAWSAAAAMWLSDAVDAPLWVRVGSGMGIGSALNLVIGSIGESYKAARARGKDA